MKSSSKKKKISQTRVLLLFLFISSPISLYSQIFVSGVVTSTDGDPLSRVAIYNSTLHRLITTNDAHGRFLIQASTNDQLVFIRNGFGRATYSVPNHDITEIKIYLEPVTKQIEEVRLYKLTGDLRKDSHLFDKKDSLAGLRKAIGLPENPEKPREKAPEMNSLGAMFNLSNLSMIISGKARKMKSLYLYEDTAEEIEWIKQRLSAQYFSDAGIPFERAREFIGYAIQKQHLKPLIQTRDLVKIEAQLAPLIPEFVARLTP